MEISQIVRTEIQIVTADDSLARQLELLLTDMGCITRRTSNPPVDSIVIIDIDTAAPLPRPRQRALIGITRTPSDLGETSPASYRHILRRPISFSELFEALEDTVLNAGIKRLSPLGKKNGKTAALTLDCVDSRLRCGRQSICLTPAEFRLAACLIDHQGSPVDTDTLLSALGEGDKNVLRVHICALRKKAEQLTGSAVIKTVRGKGYII